VLRLIVFSHAVVSTVCDKVTDSYFPAKYDIRCSADYLSEFSSSETV